MSFPKLCPFCENNKGCTPGVPFSVLTHDEARAAPKDTIELQVAITGFITKRAACFVVESSIEQAVRDGASRLVFVVPAHIPDEQLELLASVMNCTGILQLNHTTRDYNLLKEIRIVCEPQQVFAVRNGMTSQHPLCHGCFEKSD